MSGFEHYERELRELDHEILHYAALCGIDPADRPALLACLRQRQSSWPEDKARQTLEGLLVLRLKLEAEMLEFGLTAPPLMPAKDGDA
ncbi:MAG TPA: hypothetical protein VF096_09610 [Azonexus sp.]